MSYRKHSISKGARQAHHRREKARRRKLREKGGQIEPFGFVDTRGLGKKAMRIKSVTKGARDGAPVLLPLRDRDGAEGGDANAAPVPQDRQARAEGIAHD